jgi:hypothetical protein
MLIFISHSRQNSSIALGLCQVLRAQHEDTWLDMLEVHDPERLKEDVTEAVGKADAFVFIIGPAGPSDPVQQFEWEQVLDQGYYLDTSRPLIPVVVGNAELPGFLRVRQAIELEKGSTDFSDLASRVLALVRKGNNIDSAKLEHAQEARQKALRQLGEYADTLEAHERAEKRPVH